MSRLSVRHSQAGPECHGLNSAVEADQERTALQNLPEKASRTDC